MPRQVWLGDRNEATVEFECRILCHLARGNAAQNLTVWGFSVFFVLSLGLIWRSQADPCGCRWTPTGSGERLETAPVDESGSPFDWMAAASALSAGMGVRPKGVDLCPLLPEWAACC